MSLIQLYIRGISYSQTQTGAYALILEEERTQKKMPIIIGAYEAQAIAVALEQNIFPPRPLTHDLFVSMAETFGIDLIQIVIYKLSEGIFFSHLVVKQGEQLFSLDARTSDACALAIRFKSPIYTTVEILNKAGIFFDEDELEPEKEPEEKDEMDIFDYASPEDLEKFNEGMKDMFKQISPLVNLSESELLQKLEEAVEKEDYEKAQIIKRELDERKK